jgi:hypothetical protein
MPEALLRESSLDSGAEIGVCLAALQKSADSMNNIIQERGRADDHKPLVHSRFVGVLAAVVISELLGAIRRSGRGALVAKRAMTLVGRVIEKGETQGFMKVAVDAETRQNPSRIVTAE